MNNPAAPQPASGIKLPELRQDLSIQKSSATWTGAPTWLVYDGFRNKFFRIDRSSFEILSNWQPVPLARFCQGLSQKLGRPVNGQEVLDLAEFLFANSLTKTNADNNWRGYYDQAEAQNKSWWQVALHNYLFFRVPLTRPQRFLDACWPYVAPLFTKTSVALFILLAMLGLYLVQRQWQNFTNTFLDFLTLDGIAVYGASLVGVKIVHELGHAFMARKYGVAVPVMGAAFIMLFPILYTDTTGATRLADKKQRLMIDLAGIFAELALASIATVLWVFLPDGPLRSVAFTTATLSWIMSLAVNLNPFMRFDGYYVFSDMTGIENLQDRSFALARWRMREMLFALGHKVPEVLPQAWRRLVILHAWGTWVYRFMLFLGIALIVYAFFVKVIGIFLFVIEILWFILLPVWRELKVWWQMRSEIVLSKRIYITVSSLIALVVFVAVPWSSSVEVYATMHYKETATVYVPLAGKVVTHSIQEGREVVKGEVLMRLDSPDTDAEIALARKRVALLTTRLSRANADSTGRSLYRVTHRELDSEQKTLEGLLAQRAKLVVKAPVAGTLSNVDRDVHAGSWLNSDYRLAIIRPNNEIVLDGIVSQTNISRLNTGNTGRFIFNNSEFGSTPITLTQINNVALQSLPDAYLADIHGGNVPTTQSQTSEGLKPRGSWFSVKMKLSGKGQDNREIHNDYNNMALNHVRTGTAIINGTPKSIASKVATRIVAVIIRETGI